jgi:hypothetical protein
METIEQTLAAIESSLGISRFELFLAVVVLLLIWRLARTMFGKETTGMFGPQSITHYTQKSPFQVVMEGCVNFVMAFAILIVLILILIVVFKPDLIGLGT